jgi:amidase
LWQGAVVEHVISRSVRDSAAMLDATCGVEIGAPYNIAPPERPYMQEIRREPGRLKIAYNVHSPIDTPVHPEVVRATEETARLLEKLGHQVEAAQPAIDGMKLAKSYLSMYFGEVAAEIDELESILGRKAVRGDVEVLTWTLRLLGKATPSVDFVKAMRAWGQAARAMGRFHQNYDLYLTPTIAAPPVRIGALKPKTGEITALKVINALRLGKLLKMSGITDKLAVESLSKTPFTQLANFTGQPAMSVPLHRTSDGLPCGMHFMARLGDEATLFRLAAQLESERPWFHKRPNT